ncbi:hypothetical protein B0H66DRAFT_504396 [Apodospora peruviana]|uniref:Uncharacterized protein n=1 Tax=Apodospora peruviana TaxID=516989 RepID=A0AAE0HWV7_9PEZI|nr:hypothetical protein B0H66DRAFT_504396 [Apodospora peruviana]
MTCSLTASRRVAVGAAVLLAVAPQHINASTFDICQPHAERIWNGTDSYGFSPDQVKRFLYRGHVAGMDPFYNRSDYVTLTLEGCKAICSDPTDWYWSQNPTLSLGIISNWVLPIIALLAALPYDSIHRRDTRAQPWAQGRVARTLAALLNWLGSPQTALTATLFNIHQIHKCFLETNSPERSQLVLDAYYVLSAIGQYRFRNPDKPDKRLIGALVYGLFRPLVPAEEDAPEAREKTKELLQEMAFQLRMLRRRGVYPALVSIFVFFVAYAVSLVLAFGGLGDRATAHSMALGLLVSWLPLMVLFTILDRNPVSADRSKKLITRWLWNADAVRKWATHNPLPDDDEEEIIWWSQDREDEIRERQRQENADRRVQRQSRWRPLRRASVDKTQMVSVRPVNNINSDEEAVTSTPPSTAAAAMEGGLFDDHILGFVGQGREIEYCGLAHAVVNSVHDSHRQIRPIETIITKTLLELSGDRAKSWRVISLLSTGLVWLEIGMAYMISFNTPTVGLSCRSGAYIFYGFFTTIPWALHSLPGFKHPTRRQRVVIHLFSSLALLTLLFIIFAAFSGVFNNCTCKAGVSGYMDFANSDFYRDHFDVDKWWTAGSIVGALPVLGSFLGSIILLMRLKPLWQASEQQIPPTRALRADMSWLI